MKTGFRDALPERMPPGIKHDGSAEARHPLLGRPSPDRAADRCRPAWPAPRLRRTRRSCLAVPDEFFYFLDPVIAEGLHLVRCPSARHEQEIVSRQPSLPDVVRNGSRSKARPFAASALQAITPQRKDSSQSRAAFFLPGAGMSNRELVVIPSRCNHKIVPGKGLGIAENDRCLHVDIVVLHMSPGR